MPVFRRLAPFYRPYLPTLYLSVAMLAAYTAATLTAPYLTEALVNGVIRGHHYGELWKLAAAVPLLAAVAGAFNFGQQVLGQEFGQKCTYGLRQALYRRLQYHDFAYYDREHTGNLMQRLTGDVEAFRMFLTQGRVDAAGFAFNLGFALVVMLTLSPPLTGLTVLLLPFLAAVVIRFDRRVRPTYTLIRQAMSHLQTVVQESIMGVRTVKSFAREAHEVATFDEANEAYRGRNLEAAYRQSQYIPLMQFLGNLGAVLLLWYGGHLVLSGALSLGAFVAFFGLLGYLTGPIQQLGFLVNLYAQASASERRLVEILEAEDAVRDLPGALVLRPDHARGEVVLQGVSFRYPGQDGSGWTLREVDVEVPPGSVVGLVGRTGSGKSSLVSLIPRFYDCTEGRVLVDGRDVREWTLASLRRQVGIVPGETFLFSASLHENISYGRPEATREAVARAARIAQIADFIESLPRGYDTVVGERGLGLSGGQRQRVALARAILCDPRILILDDATSSVDLETEYAIQNALKAVMRGRTTFIIAHRLSSVRRADQILVLDGGRVVQRGRHEELVRQEGLYREMFAVQFQDRALLAAGARGAGGAP